ncbi:cell wall-binding repeat-containing protein [Cytobacillus firmus]|uniref:cell wall-binding repeat-containing protein n=1 Tax=Cytobacillus firmus TaxID=1399 RepID=UPI003001C7A2
MKRISQCLILLLSVLVIIWNIDMPEAKANSNLERISGDNRIHTAIKISQRGWPKGLVSQERAVILARADNPADALAAASLVGVKDAPILLTYPNTIDAATMNELARLKAAKVYILGGTGAISAGVENAIRNKGIATQRVKGSTRYDTAAAINSLTGASSAKAILVNGDTIVDALPASSYSAINKIPIYLAKRDSLPKALPSSVKEVIIFGGTGVVSENLKKSLAAKGIKVQRVSGENRYSTSVEAANLNNNTDNVIFVRGTSTNQTYPEYPDAVASSGLAKKLNTNIVLVHPTSVQDPVFDYVNQIDPKVFVLGGTGAVTDKVLTGYGLLEANSCPPFNWPADGTLTSGFGSRWGSFHYGIDIAKKGDVPVKAAYDGTVSYAGTMSGYGNTIMIRHRGDTQETLYAHLRSISVKKGQIVKTGQQIGWMGSTGQVTGQHLHFETHLGLWNGSKSNAVDPIKLLPNSSTPASCFP